MEERSKAAAHPPQPAVPGSLAPRATTAPWPIAIRLEVLSGADIVEKFANAHRYGFDAVELPGRSLAEYRADLLANYPRLALPISSLSLGFRGSLVSADPAVRRTCREDIHGLLALTRQLGATGLVIHPAAYRDRADRITGTTADFNAVAVQDELLLEQLPELARRAAELGVGLFLEALNPTLADYLCAVDHAVALCQRVNHPALRVVADFVHM